MPYTPPSRRRRGTLALIATTTATDVAPHTTGSSQDSTPGEKKQRGRPQARSSTWPPPPVPLPFEVSRSESPAVTSIEASGHVIRSVLRSPSRRRRSPDAPLIRSKSVHFDLQTDVRHFLRDDEPRAVSTRSSSPTGSSHEDSDNEECSLEHITLANYSRRSLLEIVTSFPAATVARRGLPARLERVWLVSSNDDASGPSLRGSVAVANFAYDKRVTCRFTLDSWTTQSEVAARYESAIPSAAREQPYDRFIFAIPISNIVNLERKTLLLCLRYQVSDLDFWDNNNGTNFDVKFRRRPTLEDDFQERGRRPKSWIASHHGLSATAAARGEQQPKLKPADGTDENRCFASMTNIPQHGGSTCPTASTMPDLSSRYDFSASLAAAIKAAKITSRKKQSASVDGLLLTTSLPIVQPANGQNYLHWYRRDGGSTAVLI